MPNPHGQLVDTSKSGGLSVREFWWKVLAENEKHWRSRRYVEVLDDEELADKVVAAFPSRDWSKGLRATRRWRSGYNKSLPVGKRVAKYVRDGNLLIRYGFDGSKRRITLP